MNKVHCICDDHCRHCLPFPDPDYRFDVEGITGKPLVIQPVMIDMTDEKLAGEIRKSLEITMRILKNVKAV